MSTSSEDILKTLLVTRDFLAVTLSEENLSESTEGERLNVISLVDKTINQLKTVPEKDCSSAEQIEDSIEEYEEVSLGSEVSVCSFESLQQRVSEYEHYPVSKLKESCTMSGNLLKHKNRLITKWLERYCILKDDFLFYFKNENENYKSLGVIILPGYTLKRNNFKIMLESSDKKRPSYTFQASTKRDAEEWCKHLVRVTSKQLSQEGLGIVNQIADTHQDETCSIKSDVLDSNDVPKTDDVTINEDAYNDVSTQQDVYNDIEEVRPVNKSAVNEEKSTPKEQTAFSIDNLYMGMSDCTATDTDDLSFKRGDVIYLLARLDDNWSMGYANGRTGLVPMNHLTLALTA